MNRIYVCHRYSDDPWTNTMLIKDACRAIVELGHLPVAPQLYLPQFIDESTERNLAMDLCLDLLHVCHEVWVYTTTEHPELSVGQTVEAEHAKAHLMTVRRVVDYKVTP